MLFSLMILLICCLKWAWLSIFHSFPSPEDEPSITSDHEHNKQESDAQQQQQQEEEEEEDVCSVCLCEFGEAEEITTLRCNHHFHKVCIDRWFTSGREICPLCRDETSSMSSSSWSDDGSFLILSSDDDDEYINLADLIMVRLPHPSTDHRVREAYQILGYAT
ncbi:hypothetical protein Tsubulata_018157 [Turnera subulata]|uniref:RING-type E3 ubiquitin transferase n=1 Tax=Turnera subulata TaxID=218843 RepID=A0A9Q0FZT9_9ROSI|nr:hypothetical protein Tsubulata_018157 [Turnera subulata]